MIFISHSSKEERLARRICAALEGEGMACWIASRDIGVGENFGEAIVEAIRGASAMLLVFSRNASGSDEVKKELALAGQNRLVVIPVRVEDVAPDGAFRYELATRQWIDLFDHDDREIERVGRSVRRALAVPEAAGPCDDVHGLRGSATDMFRPGAERARASSEAVAIPDPGASPPGEAAKSTMRRRTAMRGAAAASLAALGGALAWEARTGGHLWRVLHDTSLRSFTGHEAAIHAVALSPDGRTALSASADRTLGLWEIATGRRLAVLSGHSEGVISLAASPDGRHAVSGGLDDAVILWDLSERRLLRRLDGPTVRIEAVAFSPDGRLVLTGGEDGTPRLWSVKTGLPAAAFPGHAEDVAALAFSPDGHSFLSGGSDRTMRWWNAASGRLDRTFAGLPDRVTGLGFTPDGRGAVCATGDGSVRLWDLRSASEIREMPCPAVSAVAVSPNGVALVAGSGDDLKVFEVATGRRLGKLAGHTRAVSSLAVSPDSRFVLSGSDDTTLKLWDLPA